MSTGIALGAGVDRIYSSFGMLKSGHNSGTGSSYVGKSEQIVCRALVIQDLRMGIRSVGSHRS